MSKNIEQNTEKNIEKNIEKIIEGFAGRANDIFDRATADYNITDSIDAPVPQPFAGFEAVLYGKNWIDVAQWHMEDLIRDPEIEPAAGIAPVVHHGALRQRPGRHAQQRRRQQRQPPFHPSAHRSSPKPLHAGSISIHFI